MSSLMKENVHFFLQKQKQKQKHKVFFFFNLWANKTREANVDYVGRKFDLG
jgi:hypothetical protein